MSATFRGSVREPRDFYPTPLEAFTPLLPYLPKDVTIWEPACGDGRLVAAMNEYGLRAIGSDINDSFATDFLAAKSSYSCIVTNPPFSLAFEFMDHAVSHVGEVFLLLRLNFLASKKRRAWFQAHEPSALFILSQRPSFTGDGKTDATDYAWFYWGNRHKGIIHL